MRRSLSRLTEGAVERHFDVRFTPESGHVRRKRVMSALLLKADMCGATSDVCQGPKADIGPRYSNCLVGTHILRSWVFRPN